MSLFIIHVTFDCRDTEAVATFWAHTTGYARVPTGDDSEPVVLESLDRRGLRRLLFYRVPESKTLKNRVHIDLASPDPDFEIERLVGLGATVVERRTRGDRAWTVMHDPEGNEFCLG